MPFTYCYKDDDGNTFESTVHGLAFDRDYRAERVGKDLSELRNSIRAVDEQSLFLPQRNELEQHMSPRAADSYIKNWNETHEPQHSRGNRYRPR